MTSNKLLKIFISHHNSDSAKLSGFKKQVSKLGHEAFLAHEDIRPGEHDLECIEKELKECDIFLFIGCKKANESPFCQQEIGMAKGLNKNIYLVMTDKDVPQGFFSRTQAIQCKDLDNLYESVYEYLPQCKEFEQHLNKLSSKGFSLKKKKDYIHLQAVDWDDYGFRTLFKIVFNGKEIGTVKIAFIGKNASKSTEDNLPSVFGYLDDKFFSRVVLIYNPQFNQENSLRYLLNDVTILSEEKLKVISHENVLELSLFRDAEDELSQLLKE